MSNEYQDNVYSDKKYIKPNLNTEVCTPGRGDVKRFPVLDSCIYFNHAAVSPIPASAVQRMQAYTLQASKIPLSKWIYSEAGGIRDKAARLIGSHADEIAAIPNTSTGLAYVAGGIDWQPGDCVITTSIEFPANRYVWEDLKRLGVNFETVSPRVDGRIHMDDLVAKMRECFNQETSSNNLLAISHIQYATGQQIDVASLAQAVHEHGGLLCLDAIQSVGVVPVEVENWGVDFLSADGHKWMLGPEGCGIFYCRCEHVEMMRPLVAGWLPMVDRAVPLSGGPYRFEYLADARRFEPGCWNVAGMIGLNAGLGEILHDGIENIWPAVRELVSIIENGVLQLGCKIKSAHQIESERSGIVLFELPDNHAEPDKVVDQLEKQGIYIVQRVGRLRISPHFYNTPEQVGIFLEVLKETLK